MTGNKRLWFSGTRTQFEAADLMMKNPPGD